MRISRISDTYLNVTVEKKKNEPQKKIVKTPFPDRYVRFYPFLKNTSIVIWKKRPLVGLCIDFY